MKSYFTRFCPIVLALQTMVATAAEDLYKFSQFKNEVSVTIPTPYTPFGNRINFNRYGDDGSKCLLDSNGVLTWIDSDGVVRLLPNTSKAIPLFVTNSECLVWTNRFIDYTAYPSRPEATLVLYRAFAGSSSVTSSPVTSGGKEILDTPPTTTTTGALTFISTTRKDNGDETPVPLSSPVNNSDDADVRFYRVTFDANVQFVTALSIPVRAAATFATGVVGPNITSVGNGSDGSLIVKIPQVQTNPKALPANYEDQHYWVDGEGRAARLVKDAVVPTATTETISQVLFCSNTRLIYADNVGAIKEQRRSLSTGNLVGIPAAVTGLLGTALDLASYSRTGDQKFLYTLDTDKKTVRTYLIGSTSTLQSTAVLTNAITSSAITGTINPTDGSAILADEDSSTLIWLHNRGTKFSVIGTRESRPLYVTNEQAVIWENAMASVSGNGSLPSAVVVHYDSALTRTVVVTAGTNVLNTSRITPDFAYWTLNTSRKTTNSTSIVSAYKLGTLAILNVDTDGDGIIDYYETNPISPNPVTNSLLADTDGDGLSDGLELSQGTDPTVASPFAGVPTIVAGANGSGSSLLNFSDRSISTSFDGLVFDPEQGHVFRQKVTVSTKGGFSSSIAGLTTSIKGSFKGAFDATGHYMGAAPKGLPGVKTIEMQLQRNPEGWVIIGRAETVTGNILGIELRPARFGKSNLYPATKVTMALPTQETGSTGPRGNGVATGSISKYGVASLGMYLPDGGKASYSGSLLTSDLLALHAISTSANRSAVIGPVDCAPVSTDRDFEGYVRLYSASGPLGGTYPAGFDQIHTVVGSDYVAPARGFLPVSGLTTSQYNTKFSMVGGGFGGIAKAGTWGVNQVITIPGSPTESSSAKFAASSGLLSFKHTLNKAVASGYAVTLQRGAQINGFYTSSFSTGKLVVTPNDGTIPSLTYLSSVSKSVMGTGDVYDVTVQTAGAWELVLPTEASWVQAEITSGGLTSSSTVTTGETVSTTVVGVFEGTATTVVTPGSTQVVEIASKTQGFGPGTVRITVFDSQSTFAQRSTSVEIAGVQHKISQDYRTR